MQIRCFSDLKYEVTVRAEEMARRDGYDLDDPEDLDVLNREGGFGPYMGRAAGEITAELSLQLYFSTTNQTKVMPHGDPALPWAESHLCLS